MIYRKCDYCKMEITSERFLEVSIRELITDGNVNQDWQNQAYGEYCLDCIKHGLAIKDLIISINEQSNEKYEI